MDPDDERLEGLRKLLGKPSKVAPTKGKDLNELRKLLGKPLKDETAISKLQNHGIDATNNDEYTYGERALQAGRELFGTVGDIAESVSNANTALMNVVTAPIAGGLEVASRLSGNPAKPISDRQFKKLKPGLFRKAASTPFDMVAGRSLEPNDLKGQLIKGAVEYGLPVPGVSIGKGAKAISKYLAGDVATGTIVGALRHFAGKENEGYADVAGGIGIPFLAKRLVGNNISGAEKRLHKYLKDKVGEEEIPNIISAIEKNNNPENFAPGYRPTLGEVADNPILAGEERAFAGRTTSPEFGKLSNRTIEQNQAILKTLNEMVPEGYNVHQAQDFVKSEYNKLLEDVAAAEEVGGEQAARQVLDNFQRRENIQEVGAQIKRRVGNEIVEPLEQARREQAEADYEVIDNSLTREHPTRGEIYIDNKLRNESGKTRSVLEKLRRDLQTRDNEYIDYSAVGGGLERVSPRVGEINGVIKNINQLLGDEKKGSPLSAILTGLNVELKRDLEHIPMVQEASRNYERNSAPINTLERHPAIGKDIARNVRNEFLKPDANVVNKYLKGDASVQYARDLLPHIRSDKRTMDSIEGYVNSKFIEDVMDSETGRAKPKALENFRNEYKGAFELYPGLDTKLSNTSNATKMYNDLVKTNAKKIKDYQKNAAYKFLDRDPEKVASGVLAPNNNKSTMQMGEIVSELSKDKTGNALKGYQRSTAEHIMNDFRTLGEDNTNVSINKFNNLIKGKSKALGKLYNEEQMDTLGKIHNSLMARNKKYTVGKTGGSESAPKFDTMMSGLIGKLGSVGTKLGSSTTAKLGSFGLKKLSEYRNRKYNSLLIKAFLEPDFAKVMLTDIKNKKPKEVEALMSNYLKRSALRTGASLTKEEEEE